MENRLQRHPNPWSAHRFRTWESSTGMCSIIEANVSELINAIELLIPNSVQSILVYAVLEYCNCSGEMSNVNFN